MKYVLNISPCIVTVVNEDRHTVNRFIAYRHKIVREVERMKWK